MSHAVEEPEEKKSGLKEDWEASAYWRELHKDEDTRKEPGVKGFLKEELAATGYYKNHPEQYPVEKKD